MSIRKIAVGTEYKTAMHYVVGQSVINGDFTINMIEDKKTEVKIWIENKSNEIFLWKSYNKVMPMSIEYKIDFI
jgi:hypothetical protein